MANPFGDEFDDDEPQNVTIKEGFLCPICFESFNHDYQLTEHYLANHNQDLDTSASSSKIGTQIKGLIGKAKKILKDDEDFGVGNPFVDAASSSASVVTQSSQRPSTYYKQWREKQEFGQSRSHFEDLKKTRDKR